MGPSFFRSLPHPFFSPTTPHQRLLPPPPPFAPKMWFARPRFWQFTPKSTANLNFFFLPTFFPLRLKIDSFLSPERAVGDWPPRPRFCIGQLVFLLHSCVVLSTLSATALMLLFLRPWFLRLPPPGSPCPRPHHRDEDTQPGCSPAPPQPSPRHPTKPTHFFWVTLFVPPPGRSRTHPPSFRPPAGQLA